MEEYLSRSSQLSFLRVDFKPTYKRAQRTRGANEHNKHKESQAVVYNSFYLKLVTKSVGEGG